MDTNELQAWEAALDQELRLRGASGREVGEALAAVREYCHDAQVHPDEAFGEPLVYAAELRPGRLRPSNFARRVLPTLITIGAFLITVYLPSNVPPTGAVRITSGALALASLATVWGFATQWIAHRTPSWIPYAGGFVVFILVWWQLSEWKQPVLTTPLWTLWVLTGSLIGIGAWLTWRERRDHTRSPITDEALSWPRRSAFLDWFYPVFTALVFGVHILKVML